MKNQMIVVLAVVGAMALGAQTYTILQLNGQINQLSVRMSLAGNPRMEIPRLSRLAPQKLGCDNSFFEGHRESF